MAIRQVFKLSRKTFFDPRNWVDFDFLKIETVGMANSLKSSFKLPEPQIQETFAEAVQRLELTEADVKAAEKNYFFYSLFFFMLGFLSFVYTFYILFSRGIFSGWILSLAVCALCLSQAFRFDFWRLQIKKRKLGLTWNDWKFEYLGNKQGKTS